MSLYNIPMVRPPHPLFLPDLDYMLTLTTDSSFEDDFFGEASIVKVEAIDELEENITHHLTITGNSLILETVGEHLYSYLQQAIATSANRSTEQDD